jgi:hypothetical protein
VQKVLETRKECDRTKEERCRLKERKKVTKGRRNKRERIDRAK